MFVLLAWSFTGAVSIPGKKNDTRALRDVRYALAHFTFSRSRVAFEKRQTTNKKISRLGDARESDAPVEKRRPVRHAQTTHLPAHVPLQHLGPLHVSLPVKHVAVQHLGQISLPALQRLTAGSSSSTRIGVGCFLFFFKSLHSSVLRAQLSRSIRTGIHPYAHTP